MERTTLAPDEVDDLKRKLRHHDQMYATMQQQGKPFEALEHLEKGLFVRKELHGPEHPEVSKVCQVFTTSCNTLAMNSLQRGMPILFVYNVCHVHSQPAPFAPSSLWHALGWGTVIQTAPENQGNLFGRAWQQKDPGRNGFN
jgi:hypothetical protein